MDLMASYAPSMVSILIHSWVWGSRSWSTISILSPEVRMDEMVAIVSVNDRDFHIGEPTENTNNNGRLEHDTAKGGKAATWARTMKVKRAGRPGNLFGGS